MARVSVQGSDVEGKIECTVGSGDIRLLRAKVVLASLLFKAAMSSARQRCRVQGSDVEAKGNLKCRQRERAAAAELSAGLSLPVEDR